MLDRTHQWSHLDLEDLGEIYEENFNLMSTGPSSFTIGLHSFTASRVNTDTIFFQESAHFIENLKSVGIKVSLLFPILSFTSYRFLSIILYAIFWFFFHSVFHLQKLDIKEQSKLKVRKRKGKSQWNEVVSNKHWGKLQGRAFRVDQTVVPNHTNRWFSSFRPCSPAPSPAEEFVAGC